MQKDYWYNTFVEYRNQVMHRILYLKMLELGDRKNCLLISQIYQDRLYCYEQFNVTYQSPSGPNSNSFIEWLLFRAEFDLRLLGWEFYRLNPEKWDDPPHS